MSERESSLIQAVLFDMDGVLVDSEQFILEAAMMMFRETGLEVRPQDFTPFVGTGENRYLGGVAEKYGVNLDIEQAKRRTYELFASIIRGKLRPLPGARQFVRRCRELGLKIALASSADRVKVEANLGEIDLPADTFDAVVNGLDVTQRKPHPEIYEKAAAMLGVTCSRCLVVEDALSGLEAATRAGARCLMLTTSFPKEQIAGADWIAENLASAPEGCLEW